MPAGSGPQWTFIIPTEMPTKTEGVVLLVTVYNYPDRKILVCLWTNKHDASSRLTFSVPLWTVILHIELPAKTGNSPLTCLFIWANKHDATSRLAGPQASMGCYYTH